MEFRVLGPVEAWSCGDRVPLGGARQRAVLAALLVDANRVVSVDRLISAVWDERPPSTARHQIRMSVSGLRRIFVAAGEPAGLIATKPPGYSLEVEPGQLDSREFETGAASARASAAEGDLVEAVANARSALSLWRGSAWDGIPSHSVQAESTRLEERRLGLIEDCLQWELTLGRHHEVIGELITLTAEQPLRERFHFQLMLALYRDGRQAQALEAFQLARNAFQRELGLDPGDELQRLQHAILTHDPDLAAPESKEPSTHQTTSIARKPVPLQLPRDLDDFADRTDELERITEVLTNGGSNLNAVPIVTITGAGGVGKSALAVKAAHAVSDVLSDGQLYVDLHGAQLSAAADPAEILARFLRALGVPGTAIPDEFDERAELYRSYLADSRRLVVLDNAANEAQIRPLLPGGSGCAVLITSRSRLTGLSGTHTVELDVLKTDAAVELLGRIASPRRIAADPHAAAVLANLCGNLPLALRIVGAKLAARAHWTTDKLAHRLTDEQRRLDELAHGDLSVRASIGLSYQTLDQRSQLLFRRLGVLTTPDFTTWAAAAVLDTTIAEASDLIDQLIDSQLIQIACEAQVGQPRFQFHDLVQVYARERMRAEEPDHQRIRAVARAAGAWLALAEQAHRKIYGGDYQIVHGRAARWLPKDLEIDLVLDNPLEWFEGERLALSSMVRQTSANGLDELSWNLAVNAATLFESRSHNDDWWETHQEALSAVIKTGNTRGHAAILNGLGELRLAQGRFDEATDYCRRAYELFESLGDSYGKAISQVRIAHVDRLSGRYDTALQNYEAALPAIRAHEDHSLESFVLRSIGQAHLDRLDVKPADKNLQQALSIAKDIGSCRDRAQILFHIGQLRIHECHPDEARHCFEQVLSITHNLGDHRGQTAALFGLGITGLHQRQLDHAKPLLDKALQRARDAGDRTYEARTLIGLGRLHHMQGKSDVAVDLLTQARAISRELNLAVHEADALHTLGTVQLDGDDTETAVATLAKAEELFALVGSPRSDEVANQIRAAGNCVA